MHGFFCCKGRRSASRHTAFQTRCAECCCCCHVQNYYVLQCMRRAQSVWPQPTHSLLSQHTVWTSWCVPIHGINFATSRPNDSKEWYANCIKDWRNWGSVPAIFFFFSTMSVSVLGTKLPPNQGLLAALLRPIRMNGALPPLFVYSLAPHNDISVNDGQHTRRWTNNIKIL